MKLNLGSFKVKLIKLIKLIKLLRLILNLGLN